MTDAEAFDPLWVDELALALFDPQRGDMAKRRDGAPTVAGMAGTLADLVRAGSIAVRPDGPETDPLSRSGDDRASVRLLLRPADARLARAWEALAAEPAADARGALARMPVLSSLPELVAAGWVDDRRWPTLTAAGFEMARQRRSLLDHAVLVDDELDPGRVPARQRELGALLLWGDVWRPAYRFVHKSRLTAVRARLEVIAETVASGEDGALWRPLRSAVLLRLAPFTH